MYGDHSYSGGIDYNYDYTGDQRLSDKTLKAEHHNTLLLRAAAQGHLPRLRYLLALKADIDHADDQGFTALHHATFSGFEDCVQELLHVGADINAYAPRTGTPLNIAASKGRTNIIRSLMQARANVELALESQYTAQSEKELLLSCWQESVKTCNDLPARFVHQANRSIIVRADSSRVSQDDAPRHDTRMSTTPPNKALSIPRHPIANPTPSPSQTIRASASQTAQLPTECPSAFVNSPSQQDAARSSRGVSYEYYVVMGAAIDQLDMGKIMHVITSGADANERYGSQKQTPLAIACKINDIDAVRKLVQQGACVYPNHLYRQESLSSRFPSGPDDIVKLPLELGPAAAAYYASCQEDLSVFKSLFTGGLIIPLLDEKTSLAWDLFANADLPAALMILELAPDLRKQGSLIEAVAENGDVGKLRALVPTKAHLYERLGKQLLMTALLDQRQEVFEYLNTLQPLKQSDLDSALHFRTLFGDLRFVKILVEAGADTSSKENGLTPLEQALVRKRKEVAQYLRPLSPKPRRSWQLFFT